jgi:hypothetical protein
VEHKLAKYVLNFSEETSRMSVFVSPSVFVHNCKNLVYGGSSVSKSVNANIYCTNHV